MLYALTPSAHFSDFFKLDFSCLVGVHLSPRSFFKAIRTVERGVPVLSRKRLFVTSVVCHPSMQDIEATGNDVAFAGHSDGSIVSFKVMNGEILKEFKAPVVETLDAGAKT